MSSPDQKTPEQELKDSVQAISNPMKVMNLITQVTQFVHFVLLGLLNIFTTPTELCVYTRHGIRYLRGRAIVTSIVAFAVMIGMRLPFIGTPLHPTWLTATILGLLIVHNIRTRNAWKRFHGGEKVHSRSVTSVWSWWSMIPLLDDEWAVQKWGLPILLLVLGLILRVWLGMSLGSYLMIVALALHCKARLLEERELAKLLDQIDQSIESERMQNAIEGHAEVIDETSSWIVPIPVPESMREEWNATAQPIVNDDVRRPAKKSDRTESSKAHSN